MIKSKPPRHCVPHFCHCEVKPKQSIILHKVIFAMESLQARFYIMDCHDFYEVSQ
ncbi:hypothetical protein [Helicobacter sp.]|uniref:hypothetical protein n=1 Tax=Helicobacter sp. TaxID=218 RepID=UPI002A918946|nr:hypothetical protein [Helicobacter sp.]